MTPKNKNQTENENIHPDEEKQGTDTVNKNESPSREDTPPEKEETAEEIKRIEGTEPAKLEYFSKEELTEKMKVLEEDLGKTSEELKKIRIESANWKDKFMRLQAEFENAQKRWNKSRNDLYLRNTASALKGFLPLYDSFKKAVENEDKNNPILRGFYDQFMNIMKSYKAEPIKVKINDAFDYTFHEALSSLEREDIPKNTILDIVQDGWKLDKDVLRYTKVIISREPKPPEPEPEPEENKQGKEEKKNKTEKEKKSEDSPEESSLGISDKEEGKSKAKSHKKHSTKTEK